MLPGGLTPDIEDTITAAIRRPPINSGMYATNNTMQCIIYTVKPGIL